MAQLTCQHRPPTYDSENSNNFLDRGILDKPEETSENIIASNIATDENASIEPFVPSRCLFCRLDAPNFSINLQHMQKDHGLFLPNPQYLVDLETFVGYLFTVINQFHECLYCRACKVTAEAVRQHMQDKGHCKISTDDGSDYEDFYDFSNGEIADPDDRTAIRVQDPAGVVIPQDDRLHLPSRRTVGHRPQSNHRRQLLLSSASGAGRVERSVAPKQQVGSETRTAPHDQGNQLATRGYNSMGMIGVSELQKRSLRAVEKKMLKMETRARNEYQAAVEKAQNRQKHFKVGAISVLSTLSEVNAD